MEVCDSKLAGGTTMKLLIAALTSIVFTAVAAGVSAEDKPAILDSKLLIGSWTHSREEDNELGGRVFRRSNLKKFPPSRFRMQYTFGLNGAGQYMYLHPADAHTMMPMRWEINPTNPRQIVITAREKGKARVSVLKVIELTGRLLRVQ